MDKFKFGIFDVFVYTLPGFITLINIYLIFIEFKTSVSETLITIFHQIDTLGFNVIIVIIIASYIIGFTLYFWGYKYFKYVGGWIWKKKLKGRVQSFSKMEGKVVLIRHNSKENFLYLELWNSLRAMSFNLSLALLISFTVLTAKIIYFSLFSFDWIAICIFHFFISTVLLRRASTFQKWNHNTLHESINKLKLQDNI